MKTTYIVAAVLLVGLGLAVLITDIGHEFPAYTVEATHSWLFLLLAGGFWLLGYLTGRNK